MAQPVTNLLVNGLNPSVVGGTGTAIKYFPLVPGASIGVSSVKNGYLYLPGNGSANGQRLAIRGGGNFSVGVVGVSTSPAVTIGLYSATFLNGNPNLAVTINPTPVLSQTFAAASEILTTPYPFSFSADIVCESGSGLARLVSGSSEIDGVAGSVSVGLISGLTGINMSNPVPFALLAGVAFSVSDAQAAANLYQFDLSQ